jgi:hypothetical protein
MTYLHRLVVTRPAAGGGTQDSDTGVWTPGPAGVQTLYDGLADVQDAGESIPRNASGMPTLNSEGTAYLADEKRAYNIQPGDAVVVHYPEGYTADAQVGFVRILDGVLLLRFL